MQTFKINQLLKHRETPGHGYYSFRSEFQSLNNNVPKQFRGNEYEEDCNWAIPMFFNIGLLSFSEKKQVLQSILSWNYEAYESTGRIASRKLSYLKNKVLQFEENKGKYFSVVGYGDWCFDIPKGYVYRGFCLNNGEEESSRKNGIIHILLTKEEDKNLPEFISEDFLNSRKYKRDETFYTWDSFIKKTGKERYK